MSKRNLIVMAYSSSHPPPLCLFRGVVASVCEAVAAAPCCQSFQQVAWIFSCVMCPVTPPPAPTLLICLIFNLCDKPNKTKHNKRQRKENANFIDTPRKMPKGSLSVSLCPQSPARKLKKGKRLFRVSQGAWQVINTFEATHLPLSSPSSQLSRFPHDKCINYSHAHILRLINTFWIVNFEMRQQNRTKTRSSRQKSSRKKWKGKRSGQGEQIHIRNGDQGT